MFPDPRLAAAIISRDHERHLRDAERLGWLLAEYELARVPRPDRYASAVAAGSAALALLAALVVVAG